MTTPAKYSHPNLSPVKNCNPDRSIAYTYPFGCHQSKAILRLAYVTLSVGDRICQPFPCVSYEATNGLSQWQQVYGVGLRQPPV